MIEQIQPTAPAADAPEWHRLVAANARRLAALLMGGAADCPVCDDPQHPPCEDCAELHRRATGFLRTAARHEDEADYLEEAWWR